MPNNPDSKFDPILADQLASGLASDSVLLLLLGLSRAADPALLDALERAGFQLASAAGDIVSGQARAEALPRIAALAEVVSIESSRGLEPEGDLPFG